MAISSSLLGPLSTKSMHLPSMKHSEWLDCLSITSKCLFSSLRSWFFKGRPWQEQKCLHNWHSLHLHFLAQHAATLISKEWAAQCSYNLMAYNNACLTLFLARALIVVELALFPFYPKNSLSARDVRSYTWCDQHFTSMIMAEREPARKFVILEDFAYQCFFYILDR